MHFYRQRNTDNPAVLHGHHRKTAKKSLRWLGVHFDRKLTFTNHVLHWTDKASRVINHLRGLCNTARGMPVPSVRRAVLTCVIPVLTYGFEAWYPGQTRTNWKGVEVYCGIQSHLQRMNAVLRNAARTILRFTERRQHTSCTSKRKSLQRNYWPKQLDVGMAFALGGWIPDTH